MPTIQEYIATEPILVKSVVGYAIRDGKVLLGLRKKVSNGLGLNLIAGIGGKVGDQPEFADETDYQAMAREMEEERGLVITKFHKAGTVIFLFPNKPSWSQTVTIFVIDEWEGEPQETEAMVPEWYDVNNVPFAQMWEDNSIWLPKILAGEEITAIFMYNEDNKTIAEYILES